MELKDISSTRNAPDEDPQSEHQNESVPAADEATPASTAEVMNEPQPDRTFDLALTFDDVHPPAGTL